MRCDSPDALRAGVGAARHDGALGEYRRRKLLLAELLQELMTIARERHDDEREGASREVLARLAEDAFQLAVVGQFSRGKSTLMNAILGAPYLPTGALPMTSVLTTVRYGSEPKAWVRRAGREQAVEVPLDELVRFVAQQSGERQELQIVAADVQVPAEILRLGFSFVDTPGIGSAITANTATTEQFLPQADAVIFVTSCDAPLSQAERTFLTHVEAHVEKLFVIVNKTDLVDVEEADRVIRFVRDQLADGDRDPVRVFGVSARQALLARINGEGELLNTSGMAAFEGRLTSFLASEKSRVFLKQTCGRARRALAQQVEDLNVARTAQTQDSGAIARSEESFERAVEDLCEQAQRLVSGIQDGWASTVAPRLIEQARAWPSELNEIVGPLIERREERRSTRRELQQQLAAVGQTVEPALEEWLREQTAELHALLSVSAGERLGALIGLRDAVQPAAADVLGIPQRESTQAGWSPADVPPLRTPRIGFGGLLKLPSARSSTRPRHPERLLSEAASAGIEAYCRQVRDALAQSAEDWTGELNDRVKKDLRHAARRVHDRLREPYRDEHAARLDGLDRDLTALEQDLIAWTPSVGAEEPVAVPVVGPGAAAGGPCAICAKVGRVAFDYLAYTQYELATRHDRRAEHAARGGFCPLHTWLYAQTADPIGIALTYSELAASLAEQLQAGGGESAEAILRWFTPASERCRVCLAVGEAERDAIAEILDQLLAADDAAAPVSLCVGHLARLLSAELPAEHGERLVAGLADAMFRASEDLRTFALKRHALRRGLLNREEQSAPRQIVARVAGSRELARPWRTDDDDRLP